MECTDNPWFVAQSIDHYFAQDNPWIAQIHSLRITYISCYSFDMFHFLFQMLERRVCLRRLAKVFIQGEAFLVEKGGQNIVEFEVWTSPV